MTDPFFSREEFDVATFLHKELCKVARKETSRLLQVIDHTERAITSINEHIHGACADSAFDGIVCVCTGSGVFELWLAVVNVGFLLRTNAQGMPIPKLSIRKSSKFDRNLIVLFDAFVDMVASKALMQCHLRARCDDYVDLIGPIVEHGLKRPYHAPHVLPYLKQQRSLLTMLMRQV